MSQGSERGKTLGYVGGFDGLRGVSVFLVVAVHAGYRDYVDGRIGLDMFFTLSGFLITALLLREYRTRQGIDFRRFYTKRARRILPALAFMLYLGILYGLLAPPGHEFRAAFASFPFIAAFTANWFEVIRGVAAAGPFAHTWSLSVEEQFYVLWPLFLMLIAFRIGRPGWLVPICLLGSLGALVARFVVASSHMEIIALLTRIDVGTDTNADHILMGCALAVVMTVGFEARRERLERIFRLALLPAVGLFIYLTFVDQWVFPHIGQTIRYPLSQSFVALMSTAIVGYLFLFPGSITSQLLSFRPLAFLGEISLGFYLFHVPMFAIARELLVPYRRPEGLVIAFVATLLLASATYFTVELPIRAGRGILALPWDRVRAWHPSPAAATASVAILGGLPLIAVMARSHL